MPTIEVSKVDVHRKPTNQDLHREKVKQNLAAIRKLSTLRG